MSTESEKAKQYSRIKYRFFFIEYVYLLIFLIFYQYSGLSKSIKEICLRLTSHYYIVVFIYVFIFSLIYYVIFFWLRFYKGFILEHKFSLSKQSFSLWMKDELKATLITGTIFFIFIELFYLLLEKSPKTWWIWLGVIWIAFSILLARLFPVLIIPLFYKYKPISNEELKVALIDLCQKYGIKILDVYQVDLSRKTKKANAGFVGLGRSKRIILSDTLLENYTPGEIKVALAHELGHRKFMHIWKLLFFGSFTTIFSFYLIYLLSDWIIKLLGISGIWDVEGFPMISLILVATGFIFLPLQNGYSRSLEKEADLFALDATASAQDFINCMKKLARQNLADPDPPFLIEFLLYDHPSISKRIRSAETWQKKSVIHKL